MGERDRADPLQLESAVRGAPRDRGRGLLRVGDDDESLRGDPSSDDRGQPHLASPVVGHGGRGDADEEVEARQDQSAQHAASARNPVDDASAADDQDRLENHDPCALRDDEARTCWKV